MNLEIIEIENNEKISILRDDSILIKDEQSALDVFMTILYETDAYKIIVQQNNLSKEFFELRNKMAGNILQKAINYKIKLAIIGDFTKYDSKALKDFIYECNKGKDICFANDETEAINFFSKLQK